MHPELTIIAAQQHIADLHRAADHYRLVHTATTASRSHAVPAPRHTAAVPVSFLDRRGSRDEGRAEVRCARATRWLRRRVGALWRGRHPRLLAQ